MAITKKTTKVETPVDERETFVSLQKNFASNEEATAKKLKCLFELQTTDNEINKLVQLRGELPKEVEELQADVEALKSKQARVEQNIENNKLIIEKSKKDIEEIEAEIAKYSEMLNAGISNSREYDSLDKEIENLQLLRQIAEKHSNEAKDNIVDRRYELEHIKERIEIREEDLIIKSEELGGIVESTSAEEEALLEKRSELIAKLDDRTISSYERIRKSTHNNLAVVALYPPVRVENAKDGKELPTHIYGDACGGCFQVVTPQRINDILSGTKLVICEHCGRIIVNPDI